MTAPTIRPPKNVPVWNMQMQSVAGCGVGAGGVDFGSASGVVLVGPGDGKVVLVIVVVAGVVVCVAGDVSEAAVEPVAFAVTLAIVADDVSVVF